VPASLETANLQGLSRRLLYYSVRATRKPNELFFAGPMLGKTSSAYQTRPRFIFVHNTSQFVVHGEIQTLANDIIKRLIKRGETCVASRPFDLMPQAGETSDYACKLNKK
jgi:hypothetical protein